MDYTIYYIIYIYIFVLIAMTPTKLFPPGRWENTTSLGPKRHNFNSTFGVAELLWFWLRQPCNDDAAQGVDICRIQKRLIHLCAQRIEICFNDGQVRLTTQPPVAQANDTFADSDNWVSSKTRNQAAQELRNELIRRFLTKNTGFVSGLKHSENKDLVGMGKETVDDAAGANAATQFATAYFARASTALLGKLVKQEYRHLAMYFDAATVCKFNVMEIHVSVDGLVVSAPLSLLPQLKQPYEKSSQQCLEAIQDIELDVPLHEVKTGTPAASMKEICSKTKASTRQKLLGLNQSLGNLIQYKFADSVPTVQLRPPKKNEQRTYCKDANGKMVAYLWNNVTKNSVWQNSDCVGKHLVRLSFISDEGETVGALSLMEGGLAIMPHRDVQHRLHRNELSSQADVSQIDHAMKQVLLICKSASAPWHSGMFHRKSLETYQKIGELPEDHVLLDICSGGIIHDLNLDPQTPISEVKAILIEFGRTQGRSLHAPSSGDAKTGRWGTYVDNFARLKRSWHIKLFYLLFSYVLEGVSPWAAIAGANASAGSDSQAIMPKVLRANWLELLSFYC